MSTPHAPDLTTYPTITVSGTEYPIRLDIFDVIALEKQGVDLLRSVDWDTPGADGLRPSIIERSLRIIAQGIHANMPWDELARAVDLPGMSEIINKTAEAVKKVRVLMSGAVETAPATDQPPSIQ